MPTSCSCHNQSAFFYFYLNRVLIALSLLGGEKKKVQLGALQDRSQSSVSGGFDVDAMWGNKTKQRAARHHDLPLGCLKSRLLSTFKESVALNEGQ